MQECALPWTDCGDKVSLTLLHLYLPFHSSLLSPLSPFPSFLFHTQPPPPLSSPPSLPPPPSCLTPSHPLLLLSPLSPFPSFLFHTQPLPPLSSPPSLPSPPSCFIPSHPLLLLSPLSPFPSFLSHTQPPPPPPLLPLSLPLLPVSHPATPSSSSSIIYLPCMRIPYMVTLGYALFTSLSGQWSLCTHSSALSGMYMFYAWCHTPTWVTKSTMGCSHKSMGTGN